MFKTTIFSLNVLTMASTSPFISLPVIYKRCIFTSFYNFHISHSFASTLTSYSSIYQLLLNKCSCSCWIAAFHLLLFSWLLFNSIRPLWSSSFFSSQKNYTNKWLELSIKLFVVVEMIVSWDKMRLHDEDSLLWFILNLKKVYRFIRVFFSLSCSTKFQKNWFENSLNILTSTTLVQISVAHFAIEYWNKVKPIQRKKIFL